MMLRKAVCRPLRRFMPILLAVVLLVGSAPGAWAAASAHTLWQQAYPELDDPDPAVRADAVQAIRQRKEAAATAALIDHLEDPDQRVGLYIAQALVELAPARVLPQLHAALWNLNADGRWRAAYVLGERKDTAASLALARLLLDDEVLVLRTAAEALAKMDTRLAASLLAPHLASARPAEATAAMNGLLLLGDTAVPVLAKALGSEDLRIAGSALLVLEMIGTEDALAAIGNAAS